jgi:hypothetical protein
MSRSDSLLFGCDVKDEGVLFELRFPTRYFEVLDALEGNAMEVDDIVQKVCVRALRRYVCEPESRHVEV